MNSQPHIPVEDLERLFVFGAGGFGREVAWLAEGLLRSGAEAVFLVDKAEYATGMVNDIPVWLLDDVVPGDGDAFVVAIGDPGARRAATSACLAHGLRATQLVHPRVEHSRWVDFGAGAVVCAGTILTTNIVVGPHVHINLDCTIGHDVVIEEFATLSPGVHVSGNVRIGAGAYIGTGATIINGQSGSPLEIGEGAVVAAGACVTRPVDPRAMVAGIPAVRKK